MLTTCAASIPVYFGIIKYLGFEKASGTVVSRLAVFPPVLFLVCILVFVLSLQPAYGEISRGEFTGFRNHRLRKLRRLTRTGTFIFLFAVALSILMFALLL